MKQALKKSIALHLLVFFLFWIDLPLFWSNKMTLNQVPIIVDLQDVKISEITNLPPKAKFGKEDKAASQKQRKIEKNYAKEEPKEKAPAEEPKATAKETSEVKEETPQEIKKDFLVAPQPRKPKAPKAKPQPKKEAPKAKAEPKKQAPKPEDKSKPKLANPLKSLLASVDEMERNLGPEDSEAVVKEGTQVQNMGIEGGTGGNYFSELSISEMDALAGRLRACWNLDPGAMGIEDMIIEIRATLNQDGSVRNVEILDMARYNSDNFFRSVADSARRAVYICQPYNILAEKYPDKYDKWQTMLLKFNPLNKQIN